MSKTENLQDFYNDPQNNFLIIPGQNEKSSHINVFERWNCSSVKAFTRRDYYRIVLIIGSGIFTYADKKIEINRPSLFIGNKTTPYSWIPLSPEQKGWVCVFSEHFLQFDNQIALQHNFPVFNMDKAPVYILDDKQLKEFSLLFESMIEELKSEYSYKYSLLQNYLLTLIHKVQKMEDSIVHKQETLDAKHRATFRFLELLENQFPIETPDKPLIFKSPNEFAQQLFMHVNSLNHSVKRVTGKTSSMLIAERIIREAKALLSHSDWNVSEISEALGFEHSAHFANYFRRHTAQTPTDFRKKN